MAIAPSSSAEEYYELNECSERQMFCLVMECYQPTLVRYGSLHKAPVDYEPQTGVRCSILWDIPASMRTLALTTTHPTSMLYFPHWYTELELWVIKPAYICFCCSWGTFLGRSATSTGRFTRAQRKARFSGFPALSRVNIQLHQQGCRGTTSSLQASLWGKYLVSFVQSRMTCGWWCSQVYIGQTGCSTDTMLKEHQWHICQEHPDKSAMAEHSINLGHHTAILSTKSRCLDHIIREASEIEHHPNSMNREDGSCLSKSWKPLICSMK
jgi:hypothetical protein